MSLLRKDRYPSKSNLAVPQSNYPAEEPVSPTTRSFTGSNENDDDDTNIDSTIDSDLHFNSRYDEKSNDPTSPRRNSSPFHSKNESGTQSAKSSPRSSIVNHLHHQTSSPNLNQMPSHLSSTSYESYLPEHETQDDIPSSHYKGFHARSQKDTTPPLLQPIKPKFKKKASLLGKLIYSRRESEPKESHQQKINDPQQNDFQNQNEQHNNGYMHHYQPQNLIEEASHKLLGHRHNILHSKSSVSSASSTKSKESLKAAKGKLRITSLSSESKVPPSNQAFAQDPEETNSYPYQYQSQQKSQQLQIPQQHQPPQQQPPQPPHHHHHHHSHHHHNRNQHDQHGQESQYEQYEQHPIEQQFREQQFRDQLREQQLREQEQELSPFYQNSHSSRHLYQQPQRQQQHLTQFQDQQQQLEQSQQYQQGQRQHRNSNNSFSNQLQSSHYVSDPNSSNLSPQPGTSSFDLDIDLNQMAGIVSDSQQNLPVSGNLSVNHNLSRATSSNNLNSNSWQAPDSWDVKFTEEEKVDAKKKRKESVSSMSSFLSNSGIKDDDFKNDGDNFPPIIRHPTLEDQDKNFTENLSKIRLFSSASNKPNIATATPNGKKPNYTIRIFKEDNTFTTILCQLETTTVEILNIVARKFFLPSISNFQISLRVGNGSKSLDSGDKPLKIQRYLLLLSGYTERENLPIIGREDLSFLCKFVLEKNVIRALTDEEEDSISKDYVHVDIKNMNLKTIPIIFHQHAYEIESLDVSQNSSIYIPLDFIQSCNNLRLLKFSSNRCSKFPSNIFEATKLSSLDLERNFLRELPPKISILAQLTSLNLNCNQLSVLPSTFSELKHLKYLNLSSNLFTEIPDPITNLPNLVDLNLSYNYLSTLPETISKLTKLVKLNISTNRLSKSLPRFIKNLISLTELDITYNRLSNIDALGSLPNLEILYSTKNKVSQFNDKMEKLRLFDFDRNPLTNLQFENVLPSLTVLDLSKAKITSISNDFISKIPNVEKLSLNKNHLVSLPAEIGTLKNLVFLSVFNNNLQSVPAEISELTSLQYLDLHSNNIQKLPDEIWKLSSLSVLNVSSNALTSFPKPPPNTFTKPSPTNFRQIFTNADQPRSNSDWSTSSSAISPTSRRSSSQLTSYINNNVHFTSIDGNYETPVDSETSSNTDLRRDSHTSQLNIGPTCFADSLLVLSIGDNSLSDDCFESISLLTELKTLNLSYNELIEIPYGALRRMNRLTELYLSGNELSSLPTDDLEHIKTLKLLHLNNNKFVTLPAELGKINNLQVLDVGSNQLKYNISNWPYDWNWHWNLELRYLNFSGNKRLEIKQSFGNNRAVDNKAEELDNFFVLKKLKVLGLIDVTLTTPSVPDQSVDKRIRTTTSELNTLGYGIADTLGLKENVSIRDILIQKFRGNENEVLVCLYDGKGDTNPNGGHKISKIVQESFASVFTEELSKLKFGETVPDAMRRSFLALNKEINSFLVAQVDDVNVNMSSSHRSSTVAQLSNIDALSGCGITVIYIQDKKVYCANIGDTMAVLSRNNGDHIVLTTKHDPTSRDEFERIRASGGYVSGDGKLDGYLEISRAVGFFNLLPHVHAGPDISELEITQSDDMLVMATRVLWDYVSYETAVDVMRQEKADPMIAAQKLRDYAISYGATDKITVIVLSLGRQKSKNRFGYTNKDDDVFTTKKRRDRSALEDSTLRRLESEIDPPVGEVALVFTDIKNSTLLWDTYPVAMRSAIKIHNAIMRRQLRIVGGYEVKTEGDAFMVSFPSPTSALLWCFNVQYQLLQADWPTEIVESDEGCQITDNDGNTIFRGLSVRMGIHWGSPVCERDIVTRRMDYFGPMVNRAARISACADGGQITVSSDFIDEFRQLESCHAKVKNDGISLYAAYGDERVGEIIEKEIISLEEIGFEVREVGEKKLKGLETPEFISLFYPKKLAIRFTMVKKVGGEENERSRLGGLLTLDFVYQLRTVSLQLERICSILSKDIIEKQLKTSPGFPHANNMILNKALSDVDLITFLDHLITRIESSVAILELRQHISIIKGDGSIFADDNPQSMVSVLNELSEIMKFAFDAKTKSGAISSQDKIQEI